MGWQEKENKPAPELILPSQIHLIGIGGDGMSGLAGLLLEMGYQISGSEQTDPSRIKQRPMLEFFRNQGIPVYFGHSQKNIPFGTGLIIRFSIIPFSNPEVTWAVNHGVSVLRRSEVVGKLMEGREGVAVAGTAGKTTTTAMLGLILERAGKDPTILLGARVDYLGDKNYRYGRGAPFVAEADEFDRSFLDLKYRIAIITSLFWGDHLDYFKDENEMLAAFTEFVSRIPPDGFLIVNGDDENATFVTRQARCSVVTYGIKQGKDFQIDDIRPNSHQTIFNLISGGRVLEVQIHVPGRHNVLNATAAVIASNILGTDISQAVSVISEYKGVKRRMEIKGSRNGVIVVDDFAHNPIQIQATLEGLKQWFPENRVVAVFQPRQFRRTRVFLNELAGSFKLADRVIITDISPGIGDTEREMKSIHARDLVGRIQEIGQEAIYISNFEEIVKWLLDNLKRGEIVITLGTGDVYRVGEEFLET
ncbi:MAG: UDP-N-acetylmuramate--L-alanine ligase [Microgenomates group bacterium]